MMPGGPAGGMQAPPGPGHQHQHQQQLQQHHVAQLQAQLMKSSVMGPDGKASQGYNMEAVSEGRTCHCGIIHSDLLHT